MKNIFFILIISFILLAIPAQATTYVIPSDNVVYQNLTEKTASSSDSGTILSNFTIASSVSGSFRVNFLLKSNTGAYRCVDIYQGSGTWASYQGHGCTASTSYVNISIDLSSNLGAGEFYQLRYYSGAGTVSVDTFQMSYDITTSSSIYGAVYNSDNGVYTTVDGAEVRLWFANGTGNSTSAFTTNGGTYSFSNLESGTYYIQASKNDEVDSSATEIITYVSGTTMHKNTYVFPCTQAYNCFFDSSIVSFSVYNVQLHDYATLNNVSVAVEMNTNDGWKFVKMGNVGGDGSISIQLHKSKEYKIYFSDELGVCSPVEWVGTPSQTQYIINICSINQTYNYSAPVQSYNNTSTGGGIANYFTSSNLTSNQGIDPTGQGVIMGTTLFFVLGVGTGIASIFLAVTALLGFVWLGLTSMGMVVLFILTTLSLMSIRGQI